MLMLKLYFNPLIPGMSNSKHCEGCTLSSKRQKVVSFLPVWVSETMFVKYIEKYLNKINISRFMLDFILKALRLL